MRSAGSQPAEQINANVVEAMSEVGVDISKEFPKPMSDEVVRAADAVITMGCGDARPIYPGKRYEDWEVEDPARSTSMAYAKFATRSERGSRRCSASWSATRRRSGRAEPERMGNCQDS